VDREERKEERERVLALGDPGDGLDAQGVQGEQGGGEPRARQAEADEEPPQEQGRARMEEDVDEVIAERLQGPEVLLDPERGEDHRVVLLVGLRLGPDEPQPFNPVESPVLREVGVVVPDEAGLEGRQIRGDDRRHEGQSEQPLRPHMQTIIQRPDRAGDPGPGGVPRVKSATSSGAGR
jgi:hypothetical protein